MKNPTRQGSKYRMIGAPLTVVVLGAVIALTAATQSGDAAAADLRLTGSRQEAADFIRYYHSIVLTPQQEAIKSAALSAIPAPCCANSSIANCCCPCNLAKSVWGLAHFLIAKRGYSAPQVRATVEDWLAASNPRGYSGTACFSGGCTRPFDHDGCGGMNEERIS
jgi:hypothetical protein